MQYFLTLENPNLNITTNGDDISTEEVEVLVHQVMKGDTGNGIASAVLNADYTLTITFTNGTSYTTPSIRGAAGQDGEDGADGVGISSVQLNADYTLTINLTNGTSYTTAPIRGQQGAKGDTGATGPTGPQGPKGDKGDAGTLDNVTASVDANVGTPSVVVTYDGANANFAFHNLKGVQGATGPQGATGEQGEKGDTGEKGDKGDNGEKGDKGDKGDTGSQGPKGDTGNDGVSPTVSTSKSGKTTTITIVDAQGTHTATVLDGDDATVTKQAVENVLTGNITSHTHNQYAESEDLAEVATSGDYEDLENKPTLPTKTSDLSNDSGFVTKAVSDLTNYYLKSETYTQAEVNTLISAITRIEFVVASVLPTASASTLNKIYLIPSASQKAQNVKDEFITIDNGAEAQTRYTWEQIGSTAIDLSNYYTKSEADALYAQKSVLPTASASLVGKIYQFIGTTTSDYTNGYFYKCVESGGAYSWDRVNVQPRGVEEAPVDGKSYARKNGDWSEVTASLAENLRSWSERSQREIIDEWSDEIRTTAGSLSIDSSKSAYLLRLVSGGAFKASSISATGNNQLNPSATVGGAYKFRVAKMLQGAYGTADEANGIVFCDNDGNNLHPTVRFSATEPTSENDGTVVTPYQFAGHSEYFYPAASNGWFIVSGLGVAVANACARVAWSKNYSLYEAYVAESSVSFIAAIAALVATHSALSDKMLAVGNIYDEIVFGTSVATWTRRVSCITPTWTDEDLGEGRYKHTATISSTNGAMKAGGFAEPLSGTAVLSVIGTTVSYEDDNATSSLAVKYQLDTEVTGTVSQTNAYSPSDFGFEKINGCEGDFVVRTSYYQKMPDSIYGLLSRMDNVESWEGDIDALEDAMEIDFDSIPLLCGQPMILYGAGAPSEAIVPENWIQLADGGYQWNGLPSALGQTYINTSASSNGRYTAVRNGIALTWKNF